MNYVHLLQIYAARIKLIYQLYNLTLLIGATEIHKSELILGSNKGWRANKAG